MILTTAFFSLCNAVLNYFFASENAVLAACAAITLPIAVAVISPLKLYLQMRFLLLANGKTRLGKPEISFGDSLKACELSVRLFFIKLFWLAVFEAVPAVSAAFFIGYINRNALSLRAVCAVAAGLCVLAAAGAVFYSVFIQRYSRSWFYLACYRDFSAGDAVRESVRKTRDRLSQTFFFKLSFLPWFLLCAAVFPAFYVIPYYKQSVTCLYLSR